MGHLILMLSEDWKKKVHALTGRFWVYLSGVSALALMLGVLGMGLFHSFKDSSLLANEEYFAGFINTADDALPQGINPLESSLPYAASAIRFNYDADGRLISLTHINALGLMCRIPGSRVAEQRLVYDEEGRLIAKENFDEYGASAADATGVSSRCFSYNDDGLLVEQRFYNERGENILPLMPGYAKKLITYDEQRRPTRIEYRDASDQLVVNSQGESVVVFEYSPDNQLISRKNYVDGQLSNNVDAYAIERHLTSNAGSIHRREWFDAEGKPAMNRQYAAAAIQHEKNGESQDNETLVYLGDDAQVLDQQRVVCEHLLRRDEKGNIVWECYNAADGLPCTNALLHYAERVCEYGDYDRLKKEYLWDDLGQKADCYERQYTTIGEGSQQLSLHRDGSTSTEYVASHAAPFQNEL